MPINSIAKGKRNERAFASWLKTNWLIEARRGQQFSGSPDSPDVVTSIDGLHFEVKAVERLNLEAAMEQATKDACAKIPVVAHKRNRGEWLVTLRAKDAKAFAALLRSV